MPHIRPLPLEWIRAFEAAGRLGSFVAAAAELGVTQAAVSQRIGHLEAQLGLRLFLRKARGVALTVEGETWLPQLSPHLRALQQTADDLFGSGPRRITVSASASVIQHWLVPRLRHLRPSDRLNFSLSTVVLHGDFDTQSSMVEIRYGTGPWPGLRAAKLFDEALAPVASPDLAAQGNWQALPRIALSGPRAGWADWPDPGPAPQIRFDSFAAGLAAATHGAGVLLASLPLCAPALASGLVQQLGSRILRPEGSYWLLSPSARISDGQWHTLTRLFCETAD